ncbi:MAG TPA: helix-turn-helix transcriptional regulator [Pyrinomonadaceae bacterium]|nr:helix-turn-helix transcriptional regulator [Pyrinomonadaceae bacterium]
MNRRAMPKKLGKKLRQIREGLGMSQRQIVEALNYKATPLRASQISQYENGQREPTMMLVLAYAKLAGISTDVLIDDKMKLP